MTGFLSILILLLLLVMAFLFNYKLVLQCREISSRLPKTKIKKKKRKVVYEDDLDD